MSNLSETLLQALKTGKIKHKAFAKKRDLDPTDVSRFINHGTLTKEIKQAIFTKWQDEATPIALIDAHIQDEIKASGVPVKAILQVD